MKLIGRGKAKDIYLADNGDIIFDFTDRVTAFDGAKKADYPHKGKVCCSLAACWFKILEKEGVPTHFKEKIGSNRMRAANLKILPVEVIWRNYVAGSLWRRFEKGEIKLPEDTEKVNDIIFSRLLKKDIILADFKIEFGKTPSGEILLADEVGTPDGCRFWDRQAYIRGEFLSLDKDVFRKNKGDLSAAYLEIFNRITKD
jgi:phosphoribosylaminoimidazole-succinocarboxamide synthase